MATQETRNEGPTDVSGSQIHQEGIDHIKSHSAAGGAPSQVPGTSEADRSGGIPSGAGGVSSTAFIDPVHGEEQQPGVVQQTVETVKNYLGGLNLGGGNKLSDDLGMSGSNNVTGDERARESSTASGGVMAGAAAAASSAAAGAAALVGVGEGDKKEGGTWLNYHPASATNTVDTPVSTTNVAGTATEPAPITSSTPAASEPASRDATMADAATKDASNVTSGKPDVGQDDSMSSGQTGSTPSVRPDASKDDSMPTSEQPAEAGKANEEVKEEAKDDAEKKTGSDEKKTVGRVQENKDAIPTAGGEKLGEKHWGESKIVPDVPPKRDSEAGQVSSADGQGDAQTKDNTSKNTGSAPPSSSNDSKNNEGEGEGKQKLTDKIKDKLHMGGK